MRRGSCHSVASISGAAGQKHLVSHRQELGLRVSICLMLQLEGLLAVTVDCSLLVLLKLQGPVLERRMCAILAWLMRHSGD